MHYIARVDATVLVAHFTDEQGKVLHLSVLEAIQWKHLLASVPCDSWVWVADGITLQERGQTNLGNHLLGTGENSRRGCLSRIGSKRLESVSGKQIEAYKLYYNLTVIYL